MVEIKTAGEVQAMRAAGQVVARILATVQDQAKAGMRTAELDEIARDVLAGAGDYSPFLDYKPRFAPVPFPAAICTSVNDAALHGIPGREKLADGDLVERGQRGRARRLDRRRRGLLHDRGAAAGRRRS